MHKPLDRDRVLRAVNAHDGIVYLDAARLDTLLALLASGRWWKSWQENEAIGMVVAAVRAQAEASE